MRSKDYQFSKIKWKLRESRKKGNETEILKLSRERKEKLEKYYGIEPYSYIVRTKTFSKRAREHDELLKGLHYAKIKGKDTVKMKLNKDSRRTLDNYGVRYYAIEYIIYLQKR